MKGKLVLFIILGIVFLRCSYQEKELEYKIADTSKTISDTLYFKSKQISRVKLSIIGKIEGDAIIEFENGSGRMEKIHIKDHINKVYEAEWYESALYFRYIPNNVKEGSIVIRYRGY